ncbi:hypothetical protein C3B44_03880 [Corynebacterium yudongzhengii]|uniref:Uncharacterized protein n=1 Tax=Corynebacterium yudongzhengii TaxID=2080740 RepID=A0A2U1T6E9_9CORY|nr:hypothetical protein C3B44_03880 [Corynebacterium yudongzhengii]PWC01591.1 hypothetical protein DF222_06540 [Corynebacterium yudongzhengii]
MKKSLVLVAATAPLALVACGSNGEEEEGTAADASQKTSQATSSQQADDEKDAEDKDKDKDGDAEDKKDKDGDAEDKEANAEDKDGEDRQNGNGDQANAAAGAGAGAPGAGASGQLEDPFAGGDVEVVEPEPVPGGQPASEQDARAISDLVNGIYEQETLHGFISYMPDNSCQALLAETNADAFSLEGIPNAPMDQMRGWNETHVSDTSDVLVNGDTASATVTVQTEFGPDSKTQRFRNEGGAWKFCK